ncbi:hypothetical protein C2G38_2180445 [Gigaspora rosea]|uniref:Uncharacterized protein n=1 Tax=Gigaspora rosea TaxID=44941 RepID=A0A397VBX9_9GLOM|nr:hypothetical protein C2G38_2180445 [Gigaspora rosea]
MNMKEILREERSRWSKHSYLYTKPYEPIVYGTFDNQLELLQIKGELPLVLLSHIPITSTNTNEEATTGEISNIWSNQLCNFFTKKKQHLVDLDLEEFLIRFDYSIIIYNKLKNEEYQSAQKQLISEIIKPTIPNFSNNEFTRKKKFHKNMFNFKDKEVETVFEAFVEKCKNCYCKK